MEASDRDSRIRKVLDNEITQIAVVVAIVFSFVTWVILPINNLQQEVKYIESNHLHQIEMDMAAMKTENQLNSDANTADHKSFMEEITKVQTELDDHIKNSR